MMTANRTNASPEEKVFWHLLGAEEAAQRLDVDAERGLDTAEAQARLERFGRNEIEEGRRRSPARMLLDQFTDFMILILIAAAIVSGLIGDALDTVVILAIVLLNAVIGFVQEYRAERAVAALKALAAQSAHVVRGGESVIVPTVELVPGDVVLLEAGNAVPADLRLIESAQFKTEEAALTGESQPVEKHTHVLHEADLPLGEAATAPSLARAPRLVPIGEAATAPSQLTGRTSAASRAPVSARGPADAQDARMPRRPGMAGSGLVPIGEAATAPSLARGPRLVPIGDRRNMAYKGTLVTYGRGRGVVVATGMETELGRIARLLREAEETKTPLQKRLARFGRILALAVLAICAILFVTGLLRGEPVLLMLLTAISLAVAAIPEALPAVVTVSLALGARKMAAKNALVRKLPAVETLGSVTYICSDKTGTLTENKMRVEEVFSDAQLIKDMAAVDAHMEPWSTLFYALALSNDAKADTEGGIIGDPTEVALYRAAEAAGFVKNDLATERPRAGEIPFDSERARMTTLHREPGGVIAFTKGAPERLLPLCHDMLGTAGTTPLERAAIEQAAERMAADGLRVLALACRRFEELPGAISEETVEAELTFLGLVGLMDPPRPGARDAVALCRNAGITPVMITGDHPATARTIAQRLGILEAGGEVITGQALGRLSLPEFEEHVERVRVYARTSPEQKIKIVQALQDKGEFVAMTGDGVNDAPALKRADIGVAMGITGTDVAREAGHMILLDDNFATIVSAVREGRRIFDNIRKFIKYTMTSNSGEILTIFLAPFLGLPIPLLPIHILWINLVTDGLPGLALAAEPEERGLMRRPPRPPNESIFAHGMWQHILWVGLLMGGASLFTQAWAIHTGSGHWQTMVFTVLTLSQLGHVLAIRSERDSLFTQGALSNRSLLGAFVFTFGLQMATIYVPALNPIFKTEALTLNELAFCLAMSSIVFVAVEIEKILVRCGWLYAAPPARGTH